MLARYRAGGNTQCWNSAVTGDGPRGQGRQGYASPTRICPVDQGFFGLGQVSGSGKSFGYSLAGLVLVAIYHSWKRNKNRSEFRIFLREESALSLLITLCYLYLSFLYTGFLCRHIQDSSATASQDTQPWTSRPANRHGRHTLLRKRPRRRRSPRHT